jgi:hypothetical protein
MILKSCYARIIRGLLLCETYKCFSVCYVLKGEGMYGKKDGSNEACDDMNELLNAFYAYFFVTLELDQAFFCNVCV